MTPARIRRLTLHEFRSYTSARMEPEGSLVVLYGANGSGKTNILEALSFLAPGRGLRRARLEEASSCRGSGGWAVHADVEGALGLAQLGTGYTPDGEQGTRQTRIDRESVTSATAFSDHLRVVWLTPDMDGLFRGPASERRRFLDRLVLAVDAGHGARVSALERSLRARNRLLEEHPDNDRWLDAVEHETAELAVAVAAGRAETVRRLGAVMEEMHRTPSLFPWSVMELEGPLEALVLRDPAARVEDHYRELLAESRARDRAAGRTLAGPHLSDLKVTHGPKQIAAGQGSTGEQKALMIGMILAHARLIGQMTGHLPLLLLDEVAAHLDTSRRAALYEHLRDLGVQAWMTGTDAHLFTDIRHSASIFEVTDGVVRPVAME